MSDLSLALQDAIKLTRYLGMKYIWINSLCIIQDSAQDWEKEPAKMSGHYGECSCIMGGREKFNGLWKVRFPWPYAKLVTGNEPDSKSIYFLPHPHAPNRETESPFPPPAEICFRGWTLREDLLSPRVISFEETQTFFRTPEAELYECGAIKLPEKTCEESPSR